MSDCYTPTDGEVLEAWAAHNTPDLPTALDLVGAYDAFKRWLAEHDAKVRAEALTDLEPGDLADLLQGISEGLEGLANRDALRRAAAVVRLLVPDEQDDRIEREADQ